jgi:hypothetical protein
MSLSSVNIQVRIFVLTRQFMFARVKVIYAIEQWDALWRFYFAGAYV